MKRVRFRISLLYVLFFFFFFFSLSKKSINRKRHFFVKNLMINIEPIPLKFCTVHRWRESYNFSRSNASYDNDPICPNLDREGEKERWSGAKLIIGLVGGDVVQATNGPVNVKPRCNCRFRTTGHIQRGNIFDIHVAISRLLFRAS